MEFSFGFIFTLSILFSNTIKSSQIITDVLGKNTLNISNQYRLDNYILPESYQIYFKFDVDFNKSREFLVEKCSIKININESVVSSNVTKIRLNHLLKEQENGVSLMDRNGEFVSIKMENANNATGIVEINLIDSKLDVEKQPYIIEFTNLTGIIRSDNVGIYVGEYIFEDQNRLMVATLFRSLQARYAFPCFDEPSFKANFQIFLTVPRGFKTIIGSTRIINEEDIIGYDLKRIFFERTPKISTHQLAFLISNFDRVSDPQNPNYNIYCSEGKAPYVQYALDITPKIVSGLENILRLNYADLGNPQLNQVALPMSFSSIENFGLMLYMEMEFIYNWNLSTLEELRWVFVVMGRTIAQMWFGNYVSIEWWSHRWLIEGITSYLTLKIGAEIQPGVDFGKYHVMITMKYMFEFDGAYQSHPLTSKEEDVYNISSVRQRAGYVQFYKSLSIFFMMESIMTEEKLYAGLRKILHKYKWSNMNPTQFFDVLESEGLPVEKMKEWTEEAGYPVVTVKRVNNSAILSQKRFLLQHNKSSKTKWHIPITFASKSHNTNFANITPTHWLTPTEDLVIEDAFQESDWIIVNIYHLGYYRVNYEDSLWPDILKVLNSDKFGGIPPIIRSRLVDDVMNMARIMRQSYHLAMSVTKYLEKETEFYPWFAAYNAFSYLLKRIGKRTVLGDSLKKYVAALAVNLNAHLKKQLGSIPKNNSTFISILVLNTEWFCDNDYPDYVTEAKRKFEIYKANADNYIGRLDHRYLTLCYGIKYGNTSDWNFVFEVYKTVTFPSLRKRMLQALGCSREPSVLRKFLEMTLDPTSDIKKHDYNYIFRAVLRSNVQIAQSFLQENIEEISYNYASWNALATMVIELADRFTTVAQIEKFTIFVENNQVALREAFGDLAQSCIKSAEANVKWLVTFEDELSDWLTNELDSRSGCSSVNIITLPTIALILYNIRVVFIDFKL